MDTVSVRFSDVYGRLDRDTGARNRHNAPYWICNKALSGERSGSPATITIAAGSLDEPCWDIVDAPSVARAMALLLRSPARPKRSVSELDFEHPACSLFLSRSRG